MSTAHEWEIQNQCFEWKYTVFPNFLSTQNMVQVVEGKINMEMIWGETKISSS